MSSDVAAPAPAVMPDLALGVRALAPAKVNLALEVVGRRGDGYHDIDTVMTTVDLADDVRVWPHTALDVTYVGSHARGLHGHPTDLAARAVEALARAADRPAQARVQVTKRIPHPAGLGGGSSDAAATLRALNAMWGLGWSADRLAEVGARIGSDVPFFVHGGMARCTGRGEHVEPLRDMVELRLLILLPPVGATEGKTAQRYGALRRPDFTRGEHAARLAHRVDRGAPPPARDLFNVFEAVVERTDTELTAHLAAYRAAGAPSLHLCGSGPAAYLLVAERAKLVELRRTFRDAGAEVFETRTLRRAAALELVAAEAEPPVPLADPGPEHAPA